ncbi:MAG: PqiC family protein [Deltaproteobacteria bacterium]|jgi:uncharacterized lipoprotein YmbA
MRLDRSYLTKIFLLISFAFLGGCLGGGTQKPTDYYLLQPLNSAMEQQGAATGEGTVLGVGPVRVQEYLNRPQIVTRTSTSEIKLHDFHYWGEPLGSNFTTVLAQNLSILLSTDRIFIFPYRNKQNLPLQYQVVVEVIRFDGERGGEASLLAQYYILQFQENGMKELVTRQSSFNKPLADDSFDTLVAGMSELVADLSRQIAGEIKAALAK